MDEFRQWVQERTQARVAQEFGVTQKAVSKWVNYGLPLKRVPQAVKITGIPAWKLRPDFFAREDAVA